MRTVGSDEGEGKLSIATKITFEKKDNVIDLETYASEPVRLENMKAQMAREHERARHEGRRDALLALLPALDTLERALAAGSRDTPFYEGVVATHRLFLDALRELGVEPIQSEGQSFDPNQHEAVATVPADDVEPGTVTREVRRGWRFGHELLRPAQVVVAARPEAGSKRS